MARNVSARRQERATGEALYGPAPRPLTKGLTLDDLEQALIAGKILCYAQGFAMMAAPPGPNSPGRSTCPPSPEFGAQAASSAGPC